MNFSSRKFEIKKVKCPRCGKEYLNSAKSDFVGFAGEGNPPGKPCLACLQLITRLDQREKKLLADEFSLEQEDEHIAQKMNNLLVLESSGNPVENEEKEKLFNFLLERLRIDEKRRKKILKRISKLQKEKK